MKALVACEFSGTVRDEFSRLGWDAYSCDILPTESELTKAEGKHIQGDVRDVLDDGWDVLICFPPCYRLAKSSGAHWKKDWFIKEQKEAFDFVLTLWNSGIDHISLENPIGWLNSHWRKPNQIIHPYYFGDPWMKETCLWLKNLPKLMYSKEDTLFHKKTTVEVKGHWVKPGNRRPYRQFDSVAEGAGRNKHNRSKTFPGIAKAMAEQWTEYLMKKV